MPTIDRFFDALTADYTSAIERCFPGYREMLAALLTYLPQDRSFRSILDLGSGTGNLAVLVRQAFPTAAITCVDVARESLAICDSRLQEHPGESRMIASDFRDVQFAPGEFDLIVSSIAIHHVPTNDKRGLFRKAASWLTRDGVLAYADQCRGATEDIYQRHIDQWRAMSRAAGGTEEEFAMWIEHQREHDHHETLNDQLRWLEAAGFMITDCVWRKLLWAVIQARPCNSQETLRQSEHLETDRH